MKIGELVTVDTWAWDDWDKQRAGEERAVAMFRSWIESEAPPVGFMLSPSSIGSSCLRVALYPDTAATDDDKHRLLAWLVRVSGKRFTRQFVESDKRVMWWNNEGDDKLWRKFQDADGEFELIIMLERPALGKCRIVEEEKLVKVKRLVCDDGQASEERGVLAGGGSYGT